MTFKELSIIQPLCEVLENKGYTTPTPIQEKAIPSILERRDVFGSAQTGTGKTAAFALPILQLISQQPKQKGVKSLILAPTRELAVQIGDSFAAYGKKLSVRHTTIYGGVSQSNQVRDLRRGVDIIIATPGRLLDLMNQGHVRLDNIRYFVLDEVDRMLDMGFIVDIKKIIAKLPAEKQTMFFSATVSPAIKKLANSLLKNPAVAQTSPVSSPATLVKQSVYYVDKINKKALLQHVLENDGIYNALVFTRTKRNADKVVKDLKKSGIQADAIHGDKSQNARQKALNSFKNNKTRVLVATDVASRGIDVTKLSHVINFELPDEPETYVHRIGRTGRAGMEGIALSFCASNERSTLKNINRLLKRDIAVVESHPYLSTKNSEPVAKNNRGRKPRRRFKSYSK